MLAVLGVFLNLLPLFLDLLHDVLLYLRDFAFHIFFVLFEAGRHSFLVTQQSETCVKIFIIMVFRVEVFRIYQSLERVILLHGGILQSFLENSGMLLAVLNELLGFALDFLVNFPDFAEV